MSKSKGWQFKNGKRKFVEFRNECGFPVVCNIVRVKATDNYFIYIRERTESEKDVIVNPSSFEVGTIAEIEESEF
jgi:hypothetical protein